MEVFDVKYGEKTVQARKSKDTKGEKNIYVLIREDEKYIESITNNYRGWMYSLDSLEDLGDYVKLWLADDKKLEWYNSNAPFKEKRGSVEMFDPSLQNAGDLNNLATKLYKVVQQIEDYEKRDIPVSEIFELRKSYLKSALEILGYNNIDSIGQKANSLNGELALNTIANQLEYYHNIASLAHCIGVDKYNEAKISYTIPDEMTREEYIDIARPVKKQLDENISFIKEQKASLIKENVSPEDNKIYSNAVQQVVRLLLELNADLLTSEEKEKYKISDMTSLEGSELKDRISSVIDSEEFDKACKIEKHENIEPANKEIDDGYDR